MSLRKGAGRSHLLTLPIVKEQTFSYYAFMERHPSDLHLFKIIQHFNAQRLGQVEVVVKAELEKLELKLKPGSAIAIAVGSRGIAEIDIIVKAAVGWLKDRGAQPFIVPAMGSHGGATAEGQEEVLASYGVTETEVGAPIRSSMEVMELPSNDLPINLYMDALAHKSDGVLLINRIKPHTDFHGSYESGLAKMSVIGLGKHAQALEIHRHRAMA